MWSQPFLARGCGFCEWIWTWGLRKHIKERRMWKLSIKLTNVLHKYPNQHIPNGLWCLLSNICPFFWSSDPQVTFCCGTYPDGLGCRIHSIKCLFYIWLSVLWVFSFISSCQIMVCPRRSARAFPKNNKKRVCGSYNVTSLHPKYDLVHSALSLCRSWGLPVLS